MSAERLKHLALAVLYEPSNVLARGLMGLVAHRGQVGTSRTGQPGDPEMTRCARPRIKEYLKRRAESKDRADDHWKLAVWCEQNGLKEQADAHLREVLRLEPKRESAWKCLGYKRVGGRWIKPDEAAAAKAEALHQRKANEHWRPILERLRASLQSKDRARRAEAEKALSAITDRRAGPMVWATFARGNAPLQKVAVQVFGQIDDPSASRSLVMLAVFGGSSDVRRLATETLRRRDAREFAGLLIGMIQKPIKYTVKKVGGPGQPGELLIKGQGSTPNLRRVYSPPPAPLIPLQPGDQVVMDANGQPVINRPEAVGQTGFMNVNQLLFAHAHRAAAGAIREHAQPKRPGPPGAKDRPDPGNAYDNTISSQNELFLATLPQNGLPITNGTSVNYTFVQGESIPVGRMAVERKRRQPWRNSSCRTTSIRLTSTTTR